MKKSEKKIWNKLKAQYADNTEVLDVLCKGENAVEKSEAKEIIREEHEDEGYTIYLCPSCKKEVFYTDIYCSCGQHLTYDDY